MPDPTTSPSVPLDDEIPAVDDYVDQCAGVLMRRWGVEDSDEDAYDAAVADVRALLSSGLLSIKVCPRDLNFLVISGPAGPSLYMDEYRIAGPKPWGGGTTVAEWTVKADTLRQRLREGDFRHVRDA